ncbi:hypothetical protein PanWU01x14_009050 [Parasponia andersonii]|uniref:Transmembrane protein n=1 Tax=Parasponia andersonii TaxID=3476 RepID=A0A2P5E2B0_PARAD|nr:hypothetical protein PanWU01x14_009050 [Parasponia andersonii]
MINMLLLPGERAETPPVPSNVVLLPGLMPPNVVGDVVPPIVVPVVGVVEGVVVVGVVDGVVVVGVPVGVVLLRRLKIKKEANDRKENVVIRQHPKKKKDCFVIIMHII